MVHFIHYKKTMNAISVTRIFFKEIVRLHDVPNSITHDINNRFFSHFWLVSWKMFNFSLKFSSTAYLQTDGQTKSLNKIVGNLICCIYKKSLNSGVLPWFRQNFLTTVSNIVLLAKHHLRLCTCSLQIMYSI